MNVIEKTTVAATLAATLAGCATPEGLRNSNVSDPGRHPVGPATSYRTTGNPVSDVCHGAVSGARRDAGREIHYQQRAQRHGAGSNPFTGTLSGAFGGLVGGAVRGVVDAVTGAGHDACDPAAPADNGPPPGTNYYYNGAPVNPGYKAPQNIR